MADKKAFVRYLLQNSYVDGTAQLQEMILLSMLGRLLELSFDQMDEMVSEYKKFAELEDVAVKDAESNSMTADILKVMMK